MRTIDITYGSMGLTGTMTVPDEVAYVFNPNYVDISLGSYNGVLYLAIADSNSTTTIDVSLFKGKAKCYISKILQLLFDDYISTRSKTITLTLYGKDSELITSATFMALWASVEFGMRYGYYTPFVYDRNSSPSFVRDVIWFKKFPFRISLFRQSTSYDFYGQSDKNAINTIYRGGQLTWEKMLIDDDIYTPIRKAPRVSTGTDITATALSTSAATYIDTTILKETGLVVDLAKTGITDVSGLHSVALSDVIVASKVDGLTNADSIFIPVARGDELVSSDIVFDWSKFVDSGLDIGTYMSLYGGKTGIFELTPQSMFPNTKRQLVYTIMNGVPTDAVFDADFDITFNEIADYAYVVRLLVCDDEDGIYLRWIDQYGFWQYFLFDDGSTTSKSKLSSVTVNADYEKRGVYHEAKRNIHIDNTDTQKCCAINLRKEILAYVKTISKSPHVELFLGLDIDGNELWVPVNIVADNIELNPDRQLYDYEVSVTLPDTSSQMI